MKIGSPASVGFLVVESPSFGWEAELGIEGVKALPQVRSAVS